MIIAAGIPGVVHKSRIGGDSALQGSDDHGSATGIRVDQIVHILVVGSQGRGYIFRLVDSVAHIAVEDVIGNYGIVEGGTAAAIIAHGQPILIVK